MNINQLDEMDRENFKVSLANLAQFDQSLPDICDDVSTYFKLVATLYSENAADDADISIIRSVEDRVTAEQVSDIADQQAESDDPEIREAVMAFHRSWSRRMRGILLQLAYKQYMFSITDLLRLRVINAMGYLRNQIESFALMSLFMSEPSRAREWMNIRSDQDGRDFYRSTQSAIASFRAKHDLDFAWEMASGSSQHVRFSSAILGMESEAYTQDSQHVHEIRVSFQEANRSQPESFILRGLTILRTQDRLFASIPDVLPELESSDHLRNAIDHLREKVDRLYARVPQVFPEQARRWQNR